MDIKHDPEGPTGTGTSGSTGGWTPTSTTLPTPTINMLEAFNANRARFVTAIREVHYASIELREAWTLARDIAGYIYTAGILYRVAASGQRLMIATGDAAAISYMESLDPTSNRHRRALPEELRLGAVAVRGCDHSGDDHGLVIDTDIALNYMIEHDILAYNSAGYVKRQCIPTSLQSNTVFYIRADMFVLMMEPGTTMRQMMLDGGIDIVEIPNTVYDRVHYEARPIGLLKG